MCDHTEIGSIGWADLTIDDASGMRDFYQKVVGWESEDFEMDGYNDFVMKTAPTGRPVAGICHARGINKSLPAQWLIYITVADVEASAAACVDTGGEILSPVKVVDGQGRFCVIRDPAGAVAALFQPEPHDHDHDHDHDHGHSHDGHSHD